MVYAANYGFDLIFPIYCGVANDQYRKISEPLAAMLAYQISDGLETHIRKKFRTIHNYGSGKQPGNPAGSTINAPAA